MGIFKKRPLGIISIIIFYTLVIYLNGFHLYELALLYPILGDQVLWDMSLATFFIVASLIIGIGFYFLRAWSRRIGIVFSMFSIIVYLVGVLKFGDMLLLYILVVHSLILLYLFNPKVRVVFHEAHHDLSISPPPPPPNM